MIRIIIICASIALAGCQYIPWTAQERATGPVSASVLVLPPPEAETPPVEQPEPEMPIIEREGRKFQLPDKAQTSRNDLFRLTDALDRAYRVLEFAPPYPLIRIVNRRHPALEWGAIAAASVDTEGKEYLHFRRDYLRGGKPLDGLVVHELAHLKAWRVYGIDIAKHGREFRAICAQGAISKNCTAERE